MGTTEGGEQTSWASEGRCTGPSGVRGGAPEPTIMSKYFHGFFITINSMILYFKRIIHIDDFPLNGHPSSILLYTSRHWLKTICENKLTQSTTCIVSNTSSLSQHVNKLAF